MEKEFLENIRASKIDSDVYIWSAKFCVDCYYPLTRENLSTLKTAKLESANHKRQAEFLSGRLLASLAIKPSSFIGRNNDGSPKWPEGKSASITHSKNYIFLITSNNYARRLGIDVEFLLSDISYQAITNRFITEDESIWLNELTDRKRVAASTLIFSAKEALFKAISLEIAIKSNFLSFSIRLPPSDDSLKIHITQTLSPTLLKGKYFILNYTWLAGKVLTWHNSLRS